MADGRPNERLTTQHMLCSKLLNEVCFTEGCPRSAGGEAKREEWGNILIQHIKVNNKNVLLAVHSATAYLYICAVLRTACHPAHICNG